MSRSEQYSNDYSNIAIVGILVNVALILLKGVGGYLGHSNALIADAFESSGDFFGSLLVYFGLKIASKPSDSDHQWGHGRFETLFSALLSLILLAFAALISYQCIDSLLIHKSSAPSYYTVLIALFVIVVKEYMYRYVRAKAGHSNLLVAEAIHHRIDAISTLVTLVGVTVSLALCNSWGDGVAGIICSLLIVWNAGVILFKCVRELSDVKPSSEVFEKVLSIARDVDGVKGTHHCRIRKSGLDYVIELQILCNPEISVRSGHEIAHQVIEALSARLPFKSYISIHVEPADDYGRRGD